MAGIQLLYIVNIEVVINGMVFDWLDVIWDVVTELKVRIGLERPILILMMTVKVMEMGMGMHLRILCLGGLFFQNCVHFL